MGPETVLCFHSNLLHRADANDSADPRWALICCYTATHNTPFNPVVGGTFSRLEHWDDDRVREAARRHGEEVTARRQEGRRA